MNDNKSIKKMWLFILIEGSVHFMSSSLIKIEVIEIITDYVLERKKERKKKRKKERKKNTTERKRQAHHNGVFLVVYPSSVNPAR